MSETKINASVAEKFKRTKTNPPVSTIPDITGITLGDFHVDAKMRVSSGEADIYDCSGTGPYAGKSFILKYYRREHAVKPEVIEKLKDLKCPCVAPIVSFGEYEGHQYAVLPFYENPSFAEVLAGGGRFSESELRGFIIPSVIEGLKALHDAGILHKDIKPGNLIPDDSYQHVVLIDFGISSDAGSNTFLVTSTGMTPAYSAPEAVQGMFHREADYYALGITVFELFTGFTPFQNPGLTSEEKARLAAVNKISFPENFPSRLKDLVLGLTFKDLSHRNEKDNPNRRWGYDEVRRWLNGEDVPMPDENDASEPQQKFLPYSFGDVKHQTLESLVKAMLKDPAAGIREVGRGILPHHFSLFAPDLEKICREAEESLQKNTDTVSSHQIFYRLMYRLLPELKSVFCSGQEFGNLTELGETAIAAASTGNTGFVSDLRLLQRSFLDFYASDVLKNAALADLLQKTSEQLSRNQSSDLQAAWILGYALSNKRNIGIGDKAFNDPVELLGYLKKLESEKGFSGYIKYVEAHREDLEFFAATIPEPKSREALKQVLEDLNRAIFGQGELQFKNARGFDDYVGKLLRDKQTYRMRHLLNTYDAALKEVSEKVWHSNSYENLRRTVSGFVWLGEHLFPSEQDLKTYLEQLLEEHQNTPEFFRKFVSYHNSALTELEKISALTQVVGKFRSYASSAADKQDGIIVKGVKYPAVKPKPKFKVGEYVKFGSYPQNNGSVKEPIEWLVLEVNGDEALLVSRYGLDCKQYHLNCSNGTSFGESFAELFEVSDIARLNTVVKGVVVSVDDKSVIIDTHSKSESILPVADFTDAEGNVTVKPGDEVDVVLKSIADDDGSTVCVHDGSTEICELPTIWWGDSSKTWEDCDLRRWLNDGFLKAAFSQEEQCRLKFSEVVNDDNQEYGTSGGNNTLDRVFCLSLTEVERYFKNDDERLCRPTAQAKAHGAFSDDDGYCWWWLRSPGSNDDCASGVDTDGVLDPDGYNVDCDDCVVRPALRLILNL